MKKSSLLILLILTFSAITSCNKGGYIALKDAEKGMFLDRARTVSPNTFFDRRMESELESKLNNDWFIVNENLDYIYFGKLVKKNGFNIINPFYKVKRDKVINKFPGFRSIEGKHIKAKVFQTFIKPVIDSNLITLCPQSYNVQYGKRKYQLTNDGIKANIQFIGKCYEDKMFRANIDLLLDAANMDLITSDIKLD